MYIEIRYSFVPGTGWWLILVVARSNERHNIELLLVGIDRKSIDGTLCWPTYDYVTSGLELLVGY